MNILDEFKLAKSQTRSTIIKRTIGVLLAIIMFILVECGLYVFVLSNITESSSYTTSDSTTFSIQAYYEIEDEQIYYYQQNDATGNWSKISINEASFETLLEKYEEGKFVEGQPNLYELGVFDSLHIAIFAVIIIGGIFFVISAKFKDAKDKKLVISFLANYDESTNPEKFNFETLTNVVAFKELAKKDRLTKEENLQMSELTLKILNKDKFEFLENKKAEKKAKIDAKSE